jgi:phosphatidylinositol dimannoside acyltransferase
LKNRRKKLFSIKGLFSQPFIIRLAMFIGKVLPYRLGVMTASAIGTLLGNMRRSAMVKAVRANQYIINEKNLGKEELNKIPKIIFRSAATCLFDYFHYLPRPEKLSEIVHYSPQSKIVFERIRNNQPCVIVCPHLSNFDLMGYALSLMGLGVQVLSFPNPTRSYKFQNQLRENLGMIVTPMSLSAFRQARQRLQDGGSILTGLDRPLPSTQMSKYRPTFFGYETNLPVTYVRMAIEADAPVIIMAATSQPDGTYHLESSQSIWMESADDLETEIINNANKVLREAEGLIKKYAHQWAMFYPVWPQFLDI